MCAKDDENASLYFVRRKNAIDTQQANTVRYCYYSLLLIVVWYATHAEKAFEIEEKKSTVITIVMNHKQTKVATKQTKIGDSSAQLLKTPHKEQHVSGAI